MSDTDTAPGKRLDDRVLIVVDVQPTFCEGGALPSPGANAVAERVSRYVRERGSRYAAVVTTQDWHIDPGGHFSEDPDYVDTWPPHGLAGTPEAELHPALEGLTFSASVKKGQYSGAYSGFEGTDEDGRTLEKVVRDAGVDAVDVVGLVESHCVKDTSLDARELGFDTRVLTDMTVPVSPELGALARERMMAAGVELVESGLG
ncbi:isochorismatase family protein [Georgenia halophila]|uniref:nicotinamidase n=1 Tax=Georgenia halophila TaxID=620889 RepID=A0ABP8LSF3_9MICO